MTCPALSNRTIRSVLDPSVRRVEKMIANAMSGTSVAAKRAHPHRVASICHRLKMIWPYALPMETCRPTWTCRVFVMAAMVEMHPFGDGSNQDLVHNSMGILKSSFSPDLAIATSTPSGKPNPASVTDQDLVRQPVEQPGRIVCSHLTEPHGASWGPSISFAVPGASRQG